MAKIYHSQEHLEEATEQIRSTLEKAVSGFQLSIMLRDFDWIAELAAEGHLARHIQEKKRKSEAEKD
jgi:hypothetical protein